MYTGGELFDRIVNSGNFSERDAAKYTYQITSAMKYCHDRNIVHRDLKPENILLQTTDEDSELVIIDFGTSRVVN
jgi:serine/threonine protein kinase